MIQHVYNFQYDTTCWMGEYIHELNLKYIRNSCNSVTENKQFDNKKWAVHEKTFLQRRHLGGQQTYEKNLKKVF